MRRVLILALPLFAAACYLVDQRSFDRNAGRPPAKPRVAVHVTPDPALVTIRYTTPDPIYRPALDPAVRKALALKQDALFTVTTRIPPAATIAAQAQSATDAAASGRQVAQAIVDAGAAPGQVEQLLRVDSAVSQKEISVAVR
jgi:hypothetical protein